MKHTTFLCNGAPGLRNREVVVLDYRTTRVPRLRVGLPSFVTSLLHLPDRYLDLLEIACYVYAADRSVSRGRLDAVEYQSWARHQKFLIRVRDHQFWTSDRGLGDILSKTLTWMTGDEGYEFEFLPGHETPPTNLFDSARTALTPPSLPPAVLPFSGGLDSLAGALTLLSDGEKPVVLIAHQSNGRTKKTQDALARALKAMYPGRVSFYPFECNLTNLRAREETQRSRSFLYAAIAAVVAFTYESRDFFFFENGVTSLNLPRRQDLLNSRASRTTHPQTIGRLAQFFTAFAGVDVDIQTPFFWHTKADVVKTVLMQAPDLISSSVSCSASFSHLGQGTHCGECSQCIDRRFASFATGAHERDHSGLYSVDVIRQPFQSGKAKTTAVDYLRQAAFFCRQDVGELEGHHLAELSEVLDWTAGESDGEVIARIHDLLHRHGSAVAAGIGRMRDEFEDVFEDVIQGSLLHVVAVREYLRSEVERLADQLESILRQAVPKMFANEQPRNERDLNTKIEALLGSHHEDLRSENPAARFACSTVVPDHELRGSDLLVETKYIRGGTTPAKASEGIAADLSKLPADAYLLFVVLDLDNAIRDDQEFVRDIENVRDCRVVVIH